MNNSILEQLYDILIWYAYKRTSDRELSEDLVQKTLTKVFIKDIDFCCDSSLKSYIFRALENQIIDEYRKKKIDISMDCDIETIPWENQYYSEKMEDYIDLLLEKLSESDRDILIQIDKQGVKIKEYATKNNIPQETAKTRLKRARKKLQMALHDCCEIEQDNHGKIINFMKK